MLRLCTCMRTRGYAFSWLKAFTTKRMKNFSVHFLGRKIVANDSLSFLAMCEEIFVRQIYDFKTDKANPLILDCGLNIGLASLFWIKKYPQAEIIAFEPDDKIFDIANGNLKDCDIFLVKKAVWSSETTLFFAPEGAAAGRIHDEGTLQIQTVRLADFLTKEIDFLKIDIEGAEYEVLKDCAEKLHFVKNLFLEYHSFENQPQHLAEILRIIENSGFRYYIEHNGIRSKNPYLHINSINEMDNFVNIFAYRN